MLFSVVLVSTTLAVSGQSSIYYDVPDAFVQPFKPKGLRISIPDEAGVEKFGVHVNVNKPIINREGGQVNLETHKPKNGRWMIEDPRVRLKLGDKLNYWLYVQVDDVGYYKEDITYTVTEFYEYNTTNVIGGGQSCKPTATTVNGNKACGGIIFEDLFDSFNSSNWQHVIQFADKPDYEYVVYTADTKNSYVSNGKLYIQPTLLTEDIKDLQTGTLDLHKVSTSRCTSNVNELCTKTGNAWLILNPIKSAQLRTQQSFSFRYGTVEIQAKMPSGDWIFPEIWLEPKSHKYGNKPFESGRIQIALVRANRNLVKDNKDLGARHLEVASILAFGSTVHQETFNLDMSDLWSDNFHTYSFTWTQDYMAFTVDGREIGRINPPTGGFNTIHPFLGLVNVPWSRGSKMAPFDEEFYITIGLGVGGIRAFPDGSTSNNHQKPWNNTNIKAMYQFWEDKDNWYPTWSGDESALQVEHVKVFAL